MTDLDDVNSAALAILEPEQIPRPAHLLTDDVVIHVAVHDDPLRGKDVARFLFGVLKEEHG